MARPRLCFIGPMVGRNSGRVTTQGEILADLCLAAGYAVTSVSSHSDPLRRAFDIGATMVRRRDVDIHCVQVFSGRSFAITDMASAIARGYKKKLVLVLRGGALPQFITRFPRWTSRVLSRADALVAPSVYLARAVAELGLRAQVIPNVIDLSRYRFRVRATATPRMLWMRSFHPLYNPSMAVRVLRRVRERFPDATLVMGGQTHAAETAIRNAAVDLGPAIRFAGFLDRDAKRAEMAAADIFLNTNRVDNVPVSVVEAAAAGLAIVATNVGGIADLLTDEKNALLVRDDDDRAMADAVERILLEPGLAERLSREGRALAESFDASAVMPRWHELFERVSAAAGR